MNNSETLYNDVINSFSDKININSNQSLYLDFNFDILYYVIFDSSQNNFVYKLGLNIDLSKLTQFNINYDNGFHFTVFNELGNYYYYGNMIATVKIPKDAKIYKDYYSNLWKTDKIIIEKIESMDKYWYDYNFCYNAMRISSDGDALIYIYTNIHELCMESVKQNGMTIRYVKEQTPEMCLYAVMQNGFALQYVKEQTYEICLNAVLQNGNSLKYVKEQTPELCIEAILSSSSALEYVKEQTYKMCIMAVSDYGMALCYVKKQTPKICKIAVMKDSRALKFVKNQTPMLCEIAVMKNGKALEYVKKQTPILCEIAVRENRIALEYIKDKDLLEKLKNINS